MARQVESAFAYFPLDCNFFTNNKVKALRRAHGTVGVASYVYILCAIYSHGYYYRIKDFTQFTFDVAESIANTQLAKVAAQVRESIDYMADSIGLLDRSCLDQGILTSVSVQEQYSATIAKFKRKAQIKEYGLLAPIAHVPAAEIVSEEMRNNSEEIAINSEFMQRKRKGKEKEEISLTRDKEIPTLAAIEDYCKERKNNVDPQRFFDYYSANGWMIGRNHIRDWRAVVRRWETNGYDTMRANEISGSVGDLNKMFDVLGEE